MPDIVSNTCMLRPTSSTDLGGGHDVLQQTDTILSMITMTDSVEQC